MVLVAGEPGIGKTRLAEAVASHARGRGAAIAIGRSWEAGGAPPYWPWIQALGSYARDLEPEVLAAQLGHDAQTLAAILPAAGAAAPEPPRDPGEQGRFRLFSAVAGFLRRAAAAQPLALFLDDLHAADPPSLVLLRFVAAELAQSRILILGSFRDTDVGSALAAALPDLAREGTVHRIVLGGLSATETARLLERITGTPPAPAIVDRVQERGAGNPLFAVETGRLLAAGKAGEDLPIPVRITEAIALRVRARSEPCRTLLALASVVGREFGVDLLARASTLPEDELLEALEEAERARLVGPVPAEGSRLRFSHILVRDTLYESIPAARRLRLHRRVAEALEALHAGHPDPYLAELAHHYLLAGPASAGKAAHYATRAGDRAAALHAYEAAARHFGTALRVLEASGAGDASAVSALLVSRGDALSRGGSEEESKADLRHAAALAEEHDLPGRLAGAALAYGGRFTWIRGCADPALVPLLERALAATGGERAPPRARLLARLAAARRDDSRREERVALAREALDIASEHDDPMTLATALEGYWNAAEGPDNVEEGWALTTQLVALAEVVGDKERLYMARDHRLNVMWRSCDRAGIDVEIVALGLLADELRQPAQRWAHAAVHSMLALMEGRFEEAEELISDAYTQGHPATRWNAAVSQRLSLFVLRREQGRLAEVEDTLRRSVHEYPTLLRFPCALAHLHAELGRADEARALSGELLGRDLAHEHVDAEWLFSLSLLADPCAFLADADGAARLRALLRPFEHLYAHAPVEAVFGCVARALGVLATTTGDFDDAEHHFAQALAIERRMRARPWLAHAQHDLAAMRVARGDRDAAAAPLGAARSAYDDLGMTAWATRAAALATA
jgi:tetratricopeptide (TPR) repeat protein